MMTDAIDCTAKLYAFRKTRDGVVASFVIHPNEVPDKLQTDPIGTSYVMALVEVDDATGQPKEVMPDTQHKSQPDTSPRSLKPAGEAKKGWDEYSYSQQAGMLCNDVAFRRFLAIGLRQIAVLDLDMAEDEVRDRCDVDSRTKILPGTIAEQHWLKLVADYRAWQHETEFVG